MRNPLGSTYNSLGQVIKTVSGSDLTTYTYVIHGRLTQAKTVNNATDGRDFSTSYRYDENANILFYGRNGIIDVLPDGKYIYGSQMGLNNSYDGNRLTDCVSHGTGSMYEGRTGVMSNGYCGYDANGNIVKDTRRGLLLIKYNHLNLPVDIYFNTGQRQTISYDGSGRKRSVEYSQSPSSIVNNELPDDGDYVVTSTRTYVGPHIFTDGTLEYSSFEGGYIDPAKGVMYYITDWQGNNAAVIDKSGDIVQSTTYYPYGEPTIEPQGQRFLFGGKEREHAAGRNSCDFGARTLAANAWTTPDPLAEKFYPLSPYAYCGGDPINRVDRDGKEVISLRKNSKSAVGFPDNGNLIIFAHGTNQGIYDDTNDDLIKYIEDTSDFVDVVNSKSVVYKDIDVSNNLKIIELMACHTGEYDESGKEPFAQKLSAELKNTIVKAPNGILSVKVKSKETKILKEDAKTGEQKEVRETPWRYFYNGAEISKSSFDFFNIVLKMEKIVDEIGSEINEWIKQSLL